MLKEKYSFTVPCQIKNRITCLILFVLVFQTAIPEVSKTHLGVNGLSAEGPPSKLRPLFGLFCLAIKEAAEAMETVLLSKEPVSGEMREESM